MRLNRYCSNCGNEKDVNYEVYCERCTKVDAEFRSNPENQKLDWSTFHIERERALSTAKQPLGIRSRQDSRAVFERIDTSALRD